MKAVGAHRPLLSAALLLPQARSAIIVHHAVPLQWSISYGWRRSNFWLLVRWGCFCQDYLQKCFHLLDAVDFCTEPLHALDF